MREVSLKEGYVASRIRQSRDPSGKLTYLTGEDRIAAIRGLPVVNVETGRVEEL